MHRRLAAPLAAALLLAVAAAFAADRSPVPESKRQLVLDLFELTGGDGCEEQLMGVLLARLEQNQGAVIEQAVAGTSGLSAEEQSELRAQLAGAGGFLAELRRRLPEQIDLQQQLQQVVLPRYQRHFDPQDLRAMVAFYRTPAGRKAASLLPRIAQDSIREVADAVQPQVLGLVEKIIAEEAALLGASESG
jgi:hypothetical protein